ncbi:winged helix-turn-helix domain-containing protein [Frankia sp. QA3]|uniref:winged helix-turn-helix domain-containing protein n=1 Tax=Frankia sp. QA3 TaxID=710111 RepID=UPI000269CFAA|nr:winged helix-turn-helix domain-containing protein [Frankia sp. QA3]EIV96367.1 response regulator with CheY-like receiver domain and winged-helix DNA-binding domain [Frankia sp. QA3]
MRADTQQQRAGDAGAELRREVRLDGPVVVVADGARPDAESLALLAGRERWRLVEAGGADAARRATSLRKASLVAIVTDDPRFAVEVTRAMRRSCDAPIIVVGDLDPMIRVRVLTDGADLALPTGLDQSALGAQIIALLRRVSDTWEPTVRYLSAAELHVDLWARTCLLDGAELNLSPTEFRLLAYLMRHPHRALPRFRIVRTLWGSAGGPGDTNALRIQISRLRHKITVAGRPTPLIRAVRGVGYEFTENVLEMGDDVSGAAARLSSLTMPRTVLDIARRLPRGSQAAAAEFLTTTLVTSAACDAAAIFRRGGGLMHLVAERGNTARWRELIAGGVPLRSSFAQVHAFETNQPTQIADIVGGSHGYRETTRALAADGFHSCLFVPIFSGSTAWGGLGLASRSRRPLDPAVTTFGVAIAAMFSLVIRPVSELAG